MSHRLMAHLRTLRLSRGMSLMEFEKRSGIPGVVEGSYERGDRRATLDKFDEILGFYGLELAIVPKGASDAALSWISQPPSVVAAELLLAPPSVLASLLRAVAARVGDLRDGEARERSEDLPEERE